MSDERIDQLLGFLRGREGFANHIVMCDELREALTELKREREKPAHCPSCDGDHLM